MTDCRYAIDNVTLKVWAKIRTHKAGPKRFDDNNQLFWWQRWQQKDQVLVKHSNKQEMVQRQDWESHIGTTLSYQQERELVIIPNHLGSPESNNKLSGQDIQPKKRHIDKVANIMTLKPSSQVH